MGCGGLGGYLIELLARLGVGRLTVVDGDGSAGRAASQTGARTLMVRIPVRYPGVPVSMTAKEDLESIVRLLEAVCPEIAAGSFCN